MSGRFKIEKLTRQHAVEPFDCGREALNKYLIRHALQNQAANASQAYVAVAADDIVGYYTLVVGEVAYEAAGERIKKGLARHPVPVMILARLAVVATAQGQALGAGLLKDAMIRTLQAADIAGIRAIVVHAKDDEARAFYERYDFTPSPSDPHHLVLLLKDVRATMGL